MIKFINIWIVLILYDLIKNCNKLKIIIYKSVIPKDQY
jgi:hypothetical protein